MNGDIALNGTLVLPDGYTRTTPALIMVTGSGQQNRDEEIFEHKPFAVIADALARAGIATLRYDDRGFSGYKGNINDCTTEDFKNDALAGVEFLRTRFDKVGVIGHSEGGTIALMLAAEQKADFIVSLAGMVVSGAETLLWQNKVALQESGLTDEQIDSYCKMLEKAFDLRENEGRMPDPDDYDVPEVLMQNYWAVVAQIQMPYMRHFLTLDIRPLLGNITCPVLALNGTKDIQVEHENNLSALRDGLPSDSKKLIESVEGVNHLFQHCRTGAVTEYREIEETMSPSVIDTIIQWILFQV
jgi:pimeloyl-ACP methyl ester carboxylesterase